MEVTSQIHRKCAQNAMIYPDLKDKLKMNKFFLSILMIFVSKYPWYLICSSYKVKNWALVKDCQSSMDK